MRNDASPLENVRRPLTQESGWIRGTQKTSVFQENTMSISADGILKENSSLNIEARFSGESGEVSNPLRLNEAFACMEVMHNGCLFHEAIVSPLVIDGGRSGSPISAVVIENELPANGRDGS